MSFMGGDTGLIPCLTDQEVAKVMDEAGRYGRTRAERIRWKTLMALLVNYGPRISEAVILRWDMVNFAAGTITFPTNKQFKKLPDGTQERIKRTRTLPLFPQIATLLRAHQRRVNGDPRVFPNWASVRTGRHGAWRAFQTLLKRAGISRMRLHGLRHTAGTRLAEIDPILAQSVLGHRSLSTTTVYVHARRMKKQFAKMEPILGTRIKAPWPPAAAATDPSTEPEAEGEYAPPPTAAPWGMPWAGPKAGQQPATEPKPDEDTRHRLERMEGAILFLLRGLGSRAHRGRPLPERRQPLALYPAGGDGLVVADGATPVASEPEPSPELVIPPGQEAEFLDTQQLAALSSFSAATVRNLLHHPTHPIPHYQVGGPGKNRKLLVRRSEFEAWLERWKQLPRLSPPPDPDPTGILAQGDDPPRPSRPRTPLREALKPYGLDSPTKLAKVLGPGRSRQYGDLILSGKHKVGTKVAKRLAAAIGVPFTQVLQWQLDGLAVREAAEAEAAERPAGA